MKKPLITKKLVAMLVMASAAVVVLTAFLFISVNVKKAYDMDMFVKVSAGRGAAFDLDTSIATFGRVAPGGGGSRFFTVNNTDTVPVRVVVRTSGEMAEWVVIDPPTFNVTPEEHSKMFKATCIVPEGTPDGNYTGKMTVLVFRK